MKYLSICSGIEAASVAWHPLGWQPLAFAEIEPFPSAVLAHHWPDVPNLGDMTAFESWPEDLLAQADIVAGGTPCQGFSLAGLRGSLSDARGNLTLTYAKLIDRIRARHGRPPVICVWENVPGVLNTDDNAFGCFLAALAGEDDPLQPPGGRWTDAGYVRGPSRAIAWRCFDAQYFGVAQRRERVFALASAGAFRPEEVLFELEGLRRDSPPSRETRQVAPTIPARSLGGGGLGTDFDCDCDGGLVGTYWDGGQVSQTLDAVLSKGQTMPEKNRFPAVLVPDTAHTLRAEGFDASEDGTGRGTPIVPVAFAFDCEQGGETQQGYTEEAAPPLRGKSGRTCVGFSCKDHGADAADDIAPTLRSMGHDGSHANGGGQLAIAFKPGQSEAAGGLFVTEEFSPTLQAANNGSTQVPAVIFQPRIGRNGRGYSEGAVPALNGADAGATSAMRACVATPYAVRRLTPTECARLQGFPDHHARIPWRGKPAAECPDGPQYKAYGNSWATPVARWIGERIQSHLTTR